jgi:hypothetical protein
LKAVFATYWLKKEEEDSLMSRQTALLTLALVLLAVFATAFALINYTNRVQVWPLTSFQPLTLVIGVSFLLGAGVSALLASLLHHQRKQGPVPTAQAGMPGMPTMSAQEPEQVVRL